MNDWTKRGVLAVAVVYMIVVAFRARAAWFTELPGFVYQRSSDRLFEVQLKASPVSLGEVLNPFHKILFTPITEVTDSGRLQERLDARKRSPEEIRADFDRSLLEFTPGPLTFRDLIVRPRGDLSGSELLAPELRFLESYLQGGLPGIFAGDAVLLTWTGESPLQVELLPEVLLVRDRRAAQELGAFLGGAYQP